MSVLYYDNHRNEAGAEAVTIDRIYCFRFSDFEDEHWDTLDRIYHALPEFRGYSPVPWWFQATGSSAPFLCASVEAPGLQVVGELPATDWERWDREFREATQELPSYKPE